jgi:hypothetical protein
MFLLSPLQIHGLSFHKLLYSHMYMCTHMQYMHIYVYTFIYMHIYVCICVCVYMCMCVYVYVCICVCIYIYIYIYIYIFLNRTYLVYTVLLIRASSGLNIEYRITSWCALPWGKTLSPTPSIPQLLVVFCVGLKPCEVLSVHFGMSIGVILV